ncbi:hypothetical protein LRR18_11880 [Mangrovimonas sp. AS39]|uniref:hypothetical protein n=1 Tax=Mangrovimonas futianensis TaxID=2895523 RepID=UPI001E323458|nr:hypothetical protein [Mangrovimonas futianensis]MCF1192286.1 hypothetical protein [Mangrovimonas futianensis]MCF1195965.1 hypothetical protein [Mangrovimonas futianensis]MCF1422977.1 hypothetical protein [Mangrovimonas futianensis]
MKFKYILPIILLALFSVSCSEDENDDFQPNEIEGLTKIQELSNDTHVIELYNKSGMFYTGYNEVILRIKNKSNNEFEENANLSWMPIMQMPSMNHSCPKSNPVKAAGKNTVYQGFIIYQMTNADGSGWSLNINYSIDGIDYVASSDIVVLQNELQNVSSFLGSDNTKYVVAFMEPSQPIIGINDLVIGVYKMETMMSFPIVENYSLTLDPRMPGMGNHSSPNNTNLVYNLSDKMYHANLSLTMTGYWVLNLKLLNTSEEVLKGEDITELNTQSSLYLELEF